MMGESQKQKNPALSVKTDHPGTVSPHPGPSHIQPCTAASASSEIMMDTTTDSHTSPVSLPIASETRDTSPMDNSVPLNTKFVITTSEYFSSIEALLALEKEFPSLQVLTKIKIDSTSQK